MINLTKTLALAMCFLHSFNLFSQWNGPASGILSTSNSVQISLPGNVICSPGPCTPIFETQLTGFPTSGPGSVPGGVLFPFSISNEGKIGIGTNTPQANLDIAGTLRIRGNSANPTSLQTTSTGGITLTTDGFFAGRGFFIKSPTSDILSVTPTELTYFGHTIVKGGDLIIKDANNDVQFRIYNNGLVRAREVKVNLNTIPPDYVFETTYKLMPLAELEAYITQHKHLPNIPSAGEMTEAGSVDVGSMQFQLLEKVEELTLYILQLQKENAELAKRLCAIEQAK